MKLILLILLLVNVAWAQTYIQAPALIEGVTSTATAAGTTTLTVSSQTNQRFTGTTTQTVQLPSALTIPAGRRFYISNQSTGLVTVNDGSGSLVTTVPASSSISVRLFAAGSIAGTWNVETNLSSSALDLSYFKNGGNSFGGTAMLGTNDNHALLFETNNTTAMTISQNGRVGIGTSAPGAKLHVSGGAVLIDNNQSYNLYDNTGVTFAGELTSSTGNQLQLNASTTSASLLIRTQSATPIIFHTNSSEKMRLNSAGELGIGTNSPSTSLDVTGAITTRAFDTASGSTGQIRFRELTANGTNYVGWKSPDNLGANTLWTLPSQDGSSGQVIQTSGTGVLSFVSPLTSATAFINGGNSFSGTASLGTNDNHALLFKTNNLTAMTISQSGNIGIGTLTPGTSLDVSGAITTRPIGTSTGNTGQILMRELAANGTNTVTLRAPDNLTADRTFTLPTADGASGSLMQTDGSGQLSFVTVANAISSSAFINGGNAFGGTSVLGNTDNHALNIRTNSATAIAISQNNFVAVGVAATSPLAELHVMDTGGTVADILVTNNTTGHTAADGLRIRATGSNADINNQENGTLSMTANGNTAFTISTNGYVGFNTTSPTGRVTVLNSATPSTTYTQDASTNRFPTNGSPITLMRSTGNLDDQYVGMAFMANNTATTTQSAYIGALSTSAAGNRAPIVMGQSTSGSAYVERLRIDTNGLVGIGNTSPATSMDVSGPIQSRGRTGTGNTGQIWLTELSSNGSNYQGFKSPDNLGADLLWVLPSGDGTSGQVMTTNGSGTLSWATPATSANAFLNGGNSFSGTASLGLNNNHALLIKVNDTVAMTISQSTNIGIGTLTPTSSLDVSGAITTRPTGTSTGNTGQVLFRELAANGTNTVTLKAADAMSTDISFTLPSNDGTSGQVLRTNGSGGLSWTGNLNGFVSKSSSYLANCTTDRTILYTSGPATLDLPPAASNAGCRLTVHTTGATTEITIDPNASESICDLSSVKLRGQNDEMTFWSNGTNWDSGDCYLTLSAKIDSAGNVSAENRDWISGSCSITTTAIYTCTTAGIVSSAWTCVASPARSGGLNRTAMAYGETTTQFIVATATANGTSSALTAEDFRVVCQGPR